MKICTVIPVLKKKEFEEVTHKELKSATRPDVEVTVVSLEKDPASIELMYEEEVQHPGFCRRLRRPKKRGSTP